MFLETEPPSNPGRIKRVGVESLGSTPREFPRQAHWNSCWQRAGELVIDALASALVRGARERHLAS
jgi:hypothetical protein